MNRYLHEGDLLKGKEKNLFWYIVIFFFPKPINNYRGF